MWEEHLEIVYVVDTKAIGKSSPFPPPLCHFIAALLTPAVDPPQAYPVAG